MKRWYPCIFAFVLVMGATPFLNAQRQNNNWLFGAFLGMNFNNNVMTPIPGKASSMYASAYCSSMSDPATGKLLFYTNGKNVWGSDNVGLHNGMLTTGTGNCPNSLIVPADSFRYFIFYCDDNDRIFYAFLDMRLNNGKGAVIYKDRLLASGMDLQFTAVRRLYGRGHWFVGHRKGTNEFCSFSVDADSVNHKPVVSNAGYPTYSGTRYMYGRMFSNANGTKLVYTFYHSDPNNNPGCRVQEFWMDKKCGIVTVKRDYYAFITQAHDLRAYAAYDATETFLYVFYYTSFEAYHLYQYDLRLPDPDIGKKVIATSHEFVGDMMLAPDKKIYVTCSQSHTYSSKVSVIESPSLPGPDCNFRENAIELSSAPQLGSIGVEQFPNLVVDVSAVGQDADEPAFSINAACAGSLSSFTMTDSATFEADSVHWLVNGNKIHLFHATHSYADSGTYEVAFVWYQCGFSNTIKKTVRIGLTPSLSLGSDTIVCNGVVRDLEAGPGQSYLWSTGETTRAIRAGHPGTYWVKVSNASCSVSDTIRIDHLPGILTTLGEEYFICDKEKELVRLDAGEGFDHYKWTPTGDTTQWIIVAEPADYFVVVEDYRGCKGDDNARVRRRCPVQMFFPNAFTPNGDGVNDVYRPVGTDVTEFRFTVYNRWGQEIFSTTDSAAGWNGTHEGAPATTDVYFYSCDYAGYRNKNLTRFSSKGTISLIR